jgi:hypothetical protein
LTELPVELFVDGGAAQIWTTEQQDDRPDVNKEATMAQKVWMITGASRGLGAEIAKAVLAVGDKLIATARNAKALDRLGGNENLLTASVDVTNESQVKSAVSEGLSRSRTQRESSHPVQAHEKDPRA